ncbi:PREDICTED: uncharacterized protein LOC105453447 isoform X1 [Wasmannia auropunctata]|uniref:uncharacterized protein LOC105453447 isoform X1 n=1 Tax=Wasmannia auropunctata TaxID=64793 RepID=UPI0005EE1D75|nr:PREDICTED: uncharacterized protein LOC105453447 isoform X1 [Wasmannia auropunctata]
MGNATAAANVNGNPLVTIPLSQYLEVSLFGDLHNCTTCKRSPRSIPRLLAAAHPPGLPFASFGSAAASGPEELCNRSPRSRRPLNPRPPGSECGISSQFSARRVWLWNLRFDRLRRKMAY